ncbi:MBL fold metallo-hydrolase [Curvivirga aplysinae]|uniref:MBL fold metallo-hydrolase n=1 Tax=Curvivirga aplysinae TaxID=2529852 RepID=UPI0012BC6D0F|nr:MBL fold metallo-hydrolase [Curvivirga aplysinae]MTI10749.1 MBL fold metallo-hydrolase [Curvivirga aplysinae]
MPVEIADKWFDTKRIDEDITLLWEPYVDPLLQCNIWHIRGRDQDMLVDTGLGIASLYDATRHLIDKPVEAVATHTHLDHVGSHYEFEKRTVHKAEADLLTYPEETTLDTDYWRDALAGTGCEPQWPEMLCKLPHDGYCMEHYHVKPAEPTRIVVEGDVVDLGDRQFEVLHLPGHSVGSIGLWEASTGILFSGDAIYDGPLIEEDVPTYIETMKRLRELPVSVVHGGHEPSFGRERLVELCNAFLAKRDC